MTANKDEPDKSRRSARRTSSSRPHATLDLKATEWSARRRSSKDETAAREGCKKPLQPGRARQGQRCASPAPHRAAKRGSAPSQRPPSGRSAAASSRAGPRGYGGFFTHLAAGIAGGIVALLAADMLASQLGFERARRPRGRDRALEQRYHALEATARPASRHARTRHTPRCRRGQDRQARAGRRQRRRAWRRRQDELDGSLKAVERQDRARAPTMRRAGARREARGAALDYVGGRRERPAKRAPAAARGAHRQDRRSRIDDANQLDALRKSVDQRDRHAPRRGQRGGRGGAAPARSAWTATLVDPQGRERRDRRRPQRAQGRERPRRRQPEDDAGRAEEAQGRSRRAARHLRQARGRRHRRWRRSPASSRRCSRTCRASSRARATARPPPSASCCRWSSPT